MTAFFLKIYDCLSKHRTRVWVLTGILLCLCGFSAWHMDYEEDISAFLPLDAQTKKYAEVFNDMGGQNRIAVLFRDNGNGDTAELTAAMDAFGEAVTRRDTAAWIRKLQVRVDEMAMMDLWQSLAQCYPAYLAEDDYQRFDSLLSVDGFLRQQMEQNRLMLMLPTGNFVGQSLPYDPLRMGEAVTRRLRGLDIGENFKTMDGYLFRDSTGVVFLESPFGTSETLANQSLSQLLDSCMADVRLSCPDVTVSAVGAPLIAVTNAAQIKTDTAWALGLSVLLILLILCYAFRKAGDLIWIGVAVFAGWLFALGLIALMRDGISLIVIGIGSVIIGIAVNYPLHFIGHLKEERDVRETLKELVPPLLVGNITTVSAFLCLVWLDAQAMRDLGLFGSLTLIGTILFVLVCLPVLIRPRRASAKEGTHGLLPIPMGRIAAGRRTRRVVFWMVAALTIVFGYYSTGTSFDSDMRHINYMLPHQRDGLKFLSSGTDSDSLSMFYAVAEGRTLDEALMRNEQLVDVLRGKNEVAKVAGIAGMWLSDSLYRVRVERWNTFWQRHDDAPLQLRHEAAKAGFSPDAFLPFENLMRRPLQADSAMLAAQGAVAACLGRNYVMQPSDSLFRVVNFVHAASAGKTDGESLSAGLPAGCYVFSSADVSNHLAEKLSAEFDYIGYVCAFVVFLFLWLTLGSVELSLMAFLPLAVGWVWILGIMQLLGMQFNIVNIILATFIFGQGDDYTIFITEGLMYEYTTGKRRLAKYKASVALSAVIMFVGIGTLIFSKHPAMRSLAEVAIVGMATVVFMAFYLPPLVFRWLTEKNGKRRECPVTLSRLASSLFSISFFLFGMYFVLIPFTLFVYRPLRKWWHGEHFYHRMLQQISYFVIRHVPGMRFQESNPSDETFDRPAVIVCNHQSHLDLMCIMQLSPKVIVLTNDWVWNNPFYGLVIHTAEFYPVSNGYDRNYPKLQELVSRGYSVVVFPEGTRTPDGEIGRFHKGAFTLAKSLGVDIVPLCIHGLYDVLPKHDFMLRRGQATLEVGERITAETIQSMDDRALTRTMHRHYVGWYAAMRERLETPDYWAPLLAYQQKYKVKS